MKKHFALVKLFQCGVQGVELAGTQQQAEVAYQQYTGVSYGESEKLDDAEESGTTIVETEFTPVSSKMSELIPNLSDVPRHFINLGVSMKFLAEDGYVDVGDFELHNREEYEQMYQDVQELLTFGRTRKGVGSGSRSPANETRSKELPR